MNKDGVRKELEALVATKEWSYNCTGHDEGQYCCLDKENPNYAKAMELFDRYAALQADKAVQDALQTVVAKAVENRTSVSIEIAEMLTELKGGSV